MKSFYSSALLRRPHRFLVFFIALFELFSLSVYAQSAETGSVRGTIVNSATGEYLRGAIVRVDGTGLSTISESGGSFRLTGLPAGERTLRASYAGLENAIKVITISSTTPAVVEFNLNSSVQQLGAFVVAGSREGQAAAVNQQRTANNFKNVVAADAFGDLVDNNAAELLKRLPGVAMDYNGEDASGFRLRGIDPVNTSVTVDGNSLVNASSGGFSDRGANFRQITVENIDTIEVNKAPTAAQPANSLGGQINFITKSAFTQKGRRIQLTTGLNMNTAAMTLGKSPQGPHDEVRTVLPSVAASFSDVFGENHPLGVSGTATYDGRYRYNTIYSPSYSYVPSLAATAPALAGSPTIANSLSMQEASAMTQLATFALNFDYKLSPNTTIYSRNSFRKGRNVATLNHGMTLSPGTQTAGSGTTQTAINGNTEDTIVASSGTISKTSGTAGIGGDTQTSQFTLGAKHTFGEYAIDYSGFYGRAYDNGVESKPTFLSYSLKNVGFTVTRVNSQSNPVFAQTSGADYLDLNNYSGLSGTSSARFGRDIQWGGRLDVKRSFTGTVFSTTIDTGLLYNEQNRRTTNGGRKWNFTLPVSLGQFADTRLDKGWAARGFPVVLGQSIDVNKVLDYTAAHPETMVEDILGYSLPRDLSNRKQFKEEIGAGYIMATVKYGKLTVVPGVRYEHTRDAGTGPVLYSNLGLNITDPIERLKAQYIATTRRTTYGNAFPNFQVKYDATPDLVVRAAFTNTIGRPAIGDTVPGDNINTTSQTISRNNPDLKPFFGKNYDVGLEYYFSGMGVLSAGLFRKDIQDYVQSNTYVLPGGSDNGYQGDYAGYTVTSKTNIGTARIQGLEFGYTQALNFLPGVTRHLSANATYTVVQRTPPPGIPDLTKVIPAIYNAGLTYNNGRLLIGIAYNLRKQYLTSYTAATRQSTYVRDNDRVDLTINYKLSRRATVFFDWRNMLNEKDWTTVFNRTTTYFEGGTSVNLGLRSDF